MSDSIDTNIVLRYVLGDVPEQRERAMKFLNESDSVHYLSNQALLECVYVLETAEEMTRQEVVDHLNFFLARYDGVVVYDHELTSLAFPMYLTHPKLSWADCVLAAEAEINHHEPLFTFDKKLAQQHPSAKMLD